MGCVQMRQRPGRYLGQPDRPAEADEPAECGRGLPAARGCERGGSAWMWDGSAFLTLSQTRSVPQPNSLTQPGNFTRQGRELFSEKD